MSHTYSSVGSLTTEFTPNPSCFSTVSGDGNKQLAFLPGYELGNECYPSKYPIGDATASTIAYFSPGRCPSSYSPYQLSTSMPGGDSTSIYACCPSGFFVVSDIPEARGCQKLQYNGEITFLSITGSLSGSTYVLPITTLWTVEAFSMQVRFEASDLPGLGFESSDYLRYGMPLPTSQLSNAPTSSSTALSTVRTSPSGLSQGAKVAIGIVIPVVVIAFILGVFLYFRRQGLKRCAVNQYQMSPIGSKAYEKPEADSQEIAPSWPGYVERDRGHDLNYSTMLRAQTDANGMSRASIRYEADSIPMAKRKSSSGTRRTSSLLQKVLPRTPYSPRSPAQPIGVPAAPDPGESSVYPEAAVPMSQHKEDLIRNTSDNPETEHQSLVLQEELVRIEEEQAQVRLQLLERRRQEIQAEIIKQQKS